MPSDKLQIAGRQIRCTFENRNDATIAKSLVCAVFIEVKTTLFLVIEEVKVLLGKFFLDDFLFLARSKVGRAIDAKAFGIDFKSIA